MNIQNQFQLRHLVLLAGAALWGTATPLAAQDAPTISVSDATVVKPTSTAQSAEFVVSRSGDTSFPVTVGYRTQDGSAKAGVDYAVSRGVVTIPAGETSATIQVPVLPGQKSIPQNFILQLTGASGPLVPGADLAARLSLPTGSRFFAPVAADLNGDGRLDIIGADDFDTVSIFLNITEPGGPASLAQRIVLPAGGVPYKVAIADFNADGKSDVAIGVNDGLIEGGPTPDRKGTVVVLINNTPKATLVPVFAPPVLLQSGANTTSATVGDFNGDGRPDVATANIGSLQTGGEVTPFTQSSVSVFLNTTPAGSTIASFTDRELLPGTGGRSHTLNVSDFNGDANTDLLVTNLPPPRSGFTQSAFLLNTGDRGAAETTFIVEPADVIGSISAGGPFNVIADVNGDGLPDYFFDEKTILNATPSGAFIPEFAELDVEGFVSEIADIDADGRVDLIRGASVSLNETVPGETMPKFAVPVAFDAGFTRSTGDLTGDGKNELIAAADNNDMLLVAELPFRSAQLSKSQGTATIQPTADTTPARFSFLDRFGVARGQPQVSNAILVRGINRPVPIMVNGGSYSINNGPYVTSSGLAKNGDRVRVALFSAGQFNTAAHTQLTIGGVSDVFTTRTRGPLLDVFLSRLFGFDFLNQFEIAMAGFNAPAMP